ncbi:hypothetical protein ES703_113589 [subsurface metagenome]
MGFLVLLDISFWACSPYQVLPFAFFHFLDLGASQLSGSQRLSQFIDGIGIFEPDLDQCAARKIDSACQTLSRGHINDSRDDEDSGEGKREELVLHKLEVGLLEYLHLICSAFLSFASWIESGQKLSGKQTQP